MKKAKRKDDVFVRDMPPLVETSEPEAVDEGEVEMVRTFDLKDGIVLRRRKTKNGKHSEKTE